MDRVHSVSFSHTPQKCRALTPYFLGTLAFFVLAFAIYVHSVPAKVVTTIPANSTLTEEMMTSLGEDRLNYLAEQGILQKESSAEDEAKPVEAANEAETNTEATNEAPLSGTIEL